MSDIYDYQVDYLLLLVGSNPLPNAVAGKLLTATAGAITLIYSKDGPALAQRLSAWLRAGHSDTTIDLKEVKESDANSVEESIREALTNYERKVIEEYKSNSSNANSGQKIRIGLNYTGGTKVMAVHAHLALEKWIKGPHKHDIFSSDPLFSYLDARTLQMCFDPASGRPAISFYVGREVGIGIRDLLQLHGWELEKNSPTTVPVLPQSAKALLTVHGNPANTEIWKTWLRDELFHKAKKQKLLDSPFWVFQSEQELQGQYEVKYSGYETNWKNNPSLQKLELSWPGLPTLRATMSKELEQDGDENFKLTIGIPSSHNEAVKFCKWLSGTWLESAVLSVLQDCAQELHFNDCGMDIQPKAVGSSGVHFQFDVAAMRGYQLFAFSCTTESKNRGLLKQKLFEVYVRARQMGGDEACAALVCCVTPEMADELVNEMRHDVVLKDRIRAFNREQLTGLATHIKDWVSKQSQDPEQR